MNAEANWRSASQRKSRLWNIPWSSEHQRVNMSPVISDSTENQGTAKIVEFGPNLTLISRNGTGPHSVLLWVFPDSRESRGLPMRHPIILRYILMGRILPCSFTALRKRSLTPHCVRHQPPMPTGYAADTNCAV